LAQYYPFRGILYVTVHANHRRLTLLAVITDDITLHFRILSDVDEFTLQGTFMADSPTDDVYLFVFPAGVDDSDGSLPVHLPPDSERYYWSFDPDGIEQLPQDSLDKLTLPRVNFQAVVMIWGTVGPGGL
jgi:hypothetical protein